MEMLVAPGTWGVGAVGQQDAPRGVPAIATPVRRRQGRGVILSQGAWHAMGEAAHG